MQYDQVRAYLKELDVNNLVWIGLKKVIIGERRRIPRTLRRLATALNPSYLFTQKSETLNRNIVFHLHVIFNDSKIIIIIKLKGYPKNPLF